jgi:nucleoside-diphosphate-sugar epimerase
MFVKYNIPNVLIIGGGMIGSEIADYLQKKNYQCHLLSRSFLKKKNLKVNYIKKDFKYLLSYPDFIYKNNISIIIHCANITNKTKEKNREIHFFNSIIDNKKFAIRSSKFVKTYINISTSKVYGDNHNKEIKYNSNLFPSDNYSKYKLTIDNNLFKINSNRMKIFTLRLPSVYSEISEDDIIKTFYKLINNNKILLFNNQVTYSMLYVKNLSKFIYLLLNIKLFMNNKIFLVTDNFDVKLKEIIDLIRHRINKKLYNIYIPIFLLKLILTAFNKKYLINKYLISKKVNINHTLKFIKNYRPTNYKNNIKNYILKI